MPAGRRAITSLAAPMARTTGAPRGNRARRTRACLTVPVVTSHSTTPGCTTSIGKADADLDQRLSDELDKYNASATSDVAPAEELTVKVEEDGELVAGLSGWTWGVAAGIGMTWVRDDKRGTGVGAGLLEAFESEARTRGCTHVYVTSFTFQAPAFYERLGYTETFRWHSVPTSGRDDVHMRKDI
jgi:GNAT superfamily N-acetyltransferase